MPADDSIEQRRIDVLASLFAPQPGSRVRVGIGDDAAVIAGDGRSTVSSVDVAVEGVHFERAWLPPGDIAFRAFMAAASDLAAMGALPCHALCAWTLPPGLDDTTLEALGQGTQRAAEACRLPVVGGNLSRGAELALTTTVVGVLEGEPVLRSGGKPGDGLFVSGPLGGPRLGLELLRTGRAAHDDPFVQSFRAPRARLDLSQRLAEQATCAIDLSDGLLPDLGRLRVASGVGARLRLDAVPHLAGFEACARELGLPARDCLLAGGEEYELLFAARAETLPWAVRIGELCEGALGLTVVDSQGQPCSLPRAFDHF